MNNLLKRFIELLFKHNFNRKVHKYFSTKSSLINRKVHFLHSTTSRIFILAQSKIYQQMNRNMLTK